MKFPCCQIPHSTLPKLVLDATADLNGIGSQRGCVRERLPGESTCSNRTQLKMLRYVGRQSQRIHAMGKK